MNVFVLCTGRCGSTTFVRACEHITNFSAAHESRSRLLGSDRFDYPDNHIEADNRLAWLLGRLDQTYGDRAVYVHLKRNPRDVAASLVQRYNHGIIKAYRGHGIIMGLSKRTDPMAVALDYCATVTSNIELFLRDKTRKIEVQLELAERDFSLFWEYIAAEGDLKRALSEFDVRHNATLFTSWTTRLRKRWLS